MIVEFYKYGCNYHGFFIQRKILDKTENLTKKELMEIADLRHSSLNKKECYELHSTRNGIPQKEFELLSHTHLLIIKQC